MNFIRKMAKVFFESVWMSGFAVGVMDGFASQVRGF